MALSKKNATDRAFILTLRYLEANGFQILECPPYGTVHKVHTRNSWHYDWFIFNNRRHGRAADINWPGGGTEERKRLTEKVPAIRSFGTAIIFDMTGNGNGPTAQHRNHAHLDQGSYSNLGNGQVTTRKTDLTVYDVQSILHMHVKYKDNLNDSTVMNRLKLVREASAKGGRDFPSGVKAVQQIIGAALTGKWDTQSRAAHDKTVKALKSRLKAAGLFTGTVNTTWDSALDTAVAKFNSKY